MTIKNLFALVSNQKRKQERIRLVRKLALGIGIVAVISVAAGILYATQRGGKKMRKDLGKDIVKTLETMKDTVEQKVVVMKDSVDKAKHNLHSAVKDVFDKTKNINNEVQVDKEEDIKDKKQL